MNTKRFKCGCGFETTDGKVFRTHLFLQGKKDGKGKHWSVKEATKVVTESATAIEQSLIDEASSRTTQVPAVEGLAPASKPSSFLWLWVLLVSLIVALAGVIVARILLG